MNHINRQSGVSCWALGDGPDDSLCFRAIACPIGMKKVGDGSACRTENNTYSCDLGFCAGNPNSYPPCAFRNVTAAAGTGWRMTSRRSGMSVSGLGLGWDGVYSKVGDLSWAMNGHILFREAGQPIWHLSTGSWPRDVVCAPVQRFEWMGEFAW